MPECDDATDLIKAEAELFCAFVISAITWLSKALWMQASAISTVEYYAGLKSIMEESSASQIKLDQKLSERDRLTDWLIELLIYYSCTITDKRSDRVKIVWFEILWLTWHADIASKQTVLEKFVNRGSILIVRDIVPKWHSKRAEELVDKTSDCDGVGFPA